MLKTSKNVLNILVGAILVAQLSGCVVDEHGHHHWWWHHDHPDVVVVH